MKYKFILISIVMLGAFFRLFQLANYPVSLTIDEVAIAYNSYSVLKTARDEFGIFLPLAFRSVGDYKPPILVYLMLPATYFFGLNELGTRITVAIFSIFSILLAYLIAKITFNNYYVGLVTAFLVAISPWHVNFSRASFEAIVALFFVWLGTYLFLYSKDKQGKWLWLSVIFFILSAYTYHAERIFAPLFFLSLVIIYFKEISLSRKNIIIAFFIAVFFSLPLLQIMTSIEGQQRAKMTFLTQDENISYVLHQPGEKLNLIQMVVDNNVIQSINFWIKRYLNYWDLRYLFIKGMNYTHPQMPDIGVFHLFELPLFIIGLYLFFTHTSISQKTKKLLLVWLLLGPVAASLANNDQHPLRSLPLLPVPQMFCGLAVYSLFKKYATTISRKITIVLVSLLVVSVSIVYWLNMYYIHYPIHYSEYFDYGMKQTAKYAWEHESKYSEIIVDSVFGSDGPYITGTPHLYMLYYGKYNPAISQKERINFGENFYKFNFRKITWLEDQNLDNRLFIGSPWSIPLKDIEPEQILDKIYFKNGQLGFLIVTSNKAETTK